ncbi:toll/interleukin-1 receptor domain-containing protein [Streptomyces sp. Je 1-79]|uniref:toll/interleukin-1 receptor domain-containing protein n=1 Tax=Streptomyces sp. Je 1-79 TaxID=2943847 RepID=UPI0021A7438D|nr:toll/interleukin-1 receptor domain-containing protein [Streptomyces sp. Je 1-79]MCT4352426.1 toll/interleukin-1 receptor domain-containing protein [Streptomyces sp. Je 1-79]
MGGIFVNYRQGNHIEAVRDLRERLAEHFGDEQVFLDTASIMPGDRYPDALRQRLTDCEVLLVGIHEGWADERNEAGARRLFLEEDWVCREIDLAMRMGTTVIPILLDGAVAPRAEQLPAQLGDLANRQAHSLLCRSWTTDLLQLIALLEHRVARTWHPIPAGRRSQVMQDRWLGTAIAVPALVSVGFAFTHEGAQARPGRIPVAYLVVGWSVSLMCTLLVTGFVVHALFRSTFDAWERELHSVRHETYVRRTYPAAVTIVLFALFGVFRMGELGVLPSLVVGLVVVLAVVRTAAASIQATKRDEDQWTRWPQALPVPVSRRVLRRAIARLDARTRLWSSPLTREQREKASWVLDDIGRALAALADETRRPRLTWLAQDQPWLLRTYILWVALNITVTAAHTLPAALSGPGAWRDGVLTVVVALVSLVLALGTVELGYRRQLWQRRTVLAEAAERRELLANRLAALGSQARAKPSAPAARPEELKEPT